MNDYTESLATYFRLMNINGAAHVYREAVRSGILDALKSGPETARGVAQACGTTERGTELVLHTLCAVGVARLDEDKFELTPLARILIDSGYRELGDQYWAHLPTFLKTDQPVMKMDAVAESESHYEAQATALAWMLAPAAEAAAQALDIGRTLKGVDIVDVGAGSAIWSLTMARCDPDTSVTAVDWPAVLKVATDTARRFGLEDRLTTIEGNYHEVALPQNTFDLAVVGNVTHLETPDGNRSLFAKLYDALKPCGRIVIFDIFPGQVEGDLNRTLYALGLALRTESGRVHSSQDLESFLTEVGFGPAQLTNLPVPPYAIGMLVAERPD